jgi:uncharacterized protein YjbI with pentapeptide repeats
MVRHYVLTLSAALLLAAQLVAPASASAQTGAPQCLRQANPPAPPDGGAVFARPLESSSSKPNVVVIPADSSWDTNACGGSAQGSGDVMTHPTSIAVAPGAAVLLQDQPAGLVSPWGAQNVKASDPAPVLFPGRSDWTTTNASTEAPETLVNVFNSCRQCSLQGVDATPVQPMLPTIAYEGDVTGADLTGATLHGTFNGWNMSSANLRDVTFDHASLDGAVLDHTGVTRTDFDGADLRGAHLVSLQYRAPPSFAGIRIGPSAGTCTTFKDTALVNANFRPSKTDPGCETSPLLPGSTVRLDLLDLLVRQQHANVDVADAEFVADASDRAVFAGADLHGVNLSGAKFVGFPADFTGTNFDGATLQHTSFDLAQLAGSTFRNANAAGASFEDAALAAHGSNNGAIFAGSQTNLVGADFVGADITGDSFVGADISGAAFNRALAVSTDFNGVLGKNTVFSGAHIYGDGEAFNSARDLEGADFTGAVLAGNVDTGGGFDLTGATLNDATFDGAQCIGCNFTNAHLDGAHFSRAYLPGVVFAGATLARVNLDQAWLYCGDLSNSSCATVPGSQTRWLWPLALGSEEAFGPVPFANTSLNGVSTTNVTVCPDGAQPDPTTGCLGRLLPANPANAPKIPAPCSAAAVDACPTTTSTLFDANSIGRPTAMTAAAPPTWATPLTIRGYYVGLDDDTIRLVGGGSPQIVAGQTGRQCAAPTDACGDGGPAGEAHLGSTAGLAVGLDGSLYVADPTLHRVRVIHPESPRIITTVAGDGNQCINLHASCGDGGQATDASLSGPSGVWAGPGGQIYIADGDRGIRQVHPNGTITTVMSGSYSVRSVVGDTAGNLYATTNDPAYLIKIHLADGSVTKVVGTGESGYNGNTDPNTGLLLPGNQVQINHPDGLAMALDGDVVFADTGNNLIRAYVPSSNHVINLGGLVSSDGNPQAGFNGDNRDADATEFNAPQDVATTRGPLFVVADTLNHRIREFGPNNLSGRARQGRRVGSRRARPRHHAHRRKRGKRRVTHRRARRVRRIRT